MENGNALKYHFIGNAHLDPVWLWRWQDGFAEIKATFRSALDRMIEFPDFVFTCACASYYKWVEENAPDMFEEIRARVKEGRWVITGGWWIQPDCNIPSGESFTRHSLYGQRYFKEKFGVMAKVGYNVDSFGHNGMFPQILKKSGMDSYVFSRPRDNEKNLPNLFWWESGDGSRILAFKLSNGYGNWWKDESGNDSFGEGAEGKIRADIAMADERGHDFMVFYGVGNHGGGPTVANVNLVHRFQEEFGADRALFSSPNQYFDDIAKQDLRIPVVRDDLQIHASGCYSAHSETKKNNRKSEHRLLSAEKWGSIAHGLLGFDAQSRRLRHAWEKVMFNQFHDIICGCSIKAAYDDARESFGEALNIGAEVMNAALQKISWSIDTMGPENRPLSKEKDWMLWGNDEQGTPLVVFNSLSWPVKAPIQINKLVKGVADNGGTVLGIQKVRGPQSNMSDKWNSLFMADIPAFGYRTYWVYIDKVLDTKQSGTIIVGCNVLENEYIRVEFEEHTGYIKKLYDKKNKCEVLTGRGAVPIIIDMFESDTWSHGIIKFHDELGKFSDAKLELIESGPVRAKLRATSKYNDSTIRQDFIIYSDKPDIEVDVKLDWREKHKLLKLAFPLNVEKPVATCEIPYGFIEKPTDGVEIVTQQWADVTGKTAGGAMVYGMSLLNDCKYSYDVQDAEIRMTVANSPIYADHFAERDDLCEFMDQGVQEFKYVMAPHAGTWQEADIVRKAFELNVQPVSVMETYHKGPLPLNFTGVEISADNVVAAAFKRAEDGGGYILRCYETAGSETETLINIPMLGRRWKAKFGKCEIKTFLIPDSKESDVSETNLIEL